MTFGEVTYVTYIHFLLSKNGANNSNFPKSWVFDPWGIAGVPEELLDTELPVSWHKFAVFFS